VLQDQVEQQSPFQGNRIVDALNCGAHSGPLRPLRIFKTYLLIDYALSKSR
jgi:hypothetical protein